LIISKYSCDRCAAAAETKSDGNFTTRPPDWETLRMDSNQSKFDLCPQCANEFATKVFHVFLKDWYE
jgi:hypothetical protein